MMIKPFFVIFIVISCTVVSDLLGKQLKQCQTGLSQHISTFETAVGFGRMQET